MKVIAYIMIVLTVLAWIAITVLAYLDNYSWFECIADSLLTAALFGTCILLVLGDIIKPPTE